MFCRKFWWFPFIDFDLPAVSRLPSVLQKCTENHTFFASFSYIPLINVGKTLHFCLFFRTLKKQPACILLRYAHSDHAGVGRSCFASTTNTHNIDNCVSLFAWFRKKSEQSVRFFYNGQINWNKLLVDLTMQR